MEQQPHNPDDRDHDKPPEQTGTARCEEVRIDGAPLKQVSAYLRNAFTEADARGEAIGSDDAQVVATLLAPLLGKDSETARFARTGDANPVVLHEECQRLGGHPRQTNDIGTWLQRFEQHLASRTDIGRRER